jgi:hypothetical protein
MREKALSDAVHKGNEKQARVVWLRQTSGDRRPWHDMRDVFVAADQTQINHGLTRVLEFH